MSSQEAIKSRPEFEITEGLDGSLRYLEHGYPHPLVRWHYHDDFEIHYIVRSSGKVFVGDYVGHFDPGNLVLTGPRLPHNWISNASTPVPVRDMAVQFGCDLFTRLTPVLPELETLTPLLERSRYGIEFLGDASKLAAENMHNIRSSEGPARLGHFLHFMNILAEETDYRLLSTVQLRSNADDAMLGKVDIVVKYVTDNFRDTIALSDVASLIGMSESAFSRFFSKATGNRFSDFVTRIRISKSCDLLANTDTYITNICYEVGFNNVANFNRRFRQIKGVTPREYRDSARQRFKLGG